MRGSGLGCLTCPRCCDFFNVIAAGQDLRMSVGAYHGSDTGYRGS